MSEVVALVVGPVPSAAADIPAPRIFYMSCTAYDDPSDL